MVDQDFLTELLARLQSAGSQSEKSAIVAEMAFVQLDPVAAKVARRCVILRWFDAAIVQAFIDHDAADAPDGLAAEITASLANLPFAESLDWGLAYHEQTRAGLLEQAMAADPAFLRESAALAAPAYFKMENEIASGEALYCLVVAAWEKEAHSLLDGLLETAGRRQDWQRFAAIFGTINEAESLPFVENLRLSAYQFLARGIAHHDQDDLDAAIADYDRAIALNPNDATAFYNRGNARGALGELGAAIADYDRAIALNPDDATAFNNRGNARKAQGDLDAAIADYDQAIALNPDYATAFNNRGNARADQDDLDTAIADYDQAIALNPDDATAYSNLGTVLRQLARWQDAKAAHMHAVELDATRLTDWMALADIARRHGDENAWRQAVDRARPLLDRSDAYNAACFESIAGNAEVALDLLAQVLAERPDMAAWAKDDPDLQWIREEPRFAEFIRNAEQENDDKR